jgi:phenylacetate-CoA ligase
MTGTGKNTPTRRQIEILRAWGTNVLIGFPAYLRHMALVARDEMHLDPRCLGIRTIDAALGPEDRGSIERLWGAPVYDFYGAHESGMIAAECVFQDGMHIQEDAFIVEILDVGTGLPVPPGAPGNVCVTTLFKHSAPLVRYNIADVSSFRPGQCACGSTLQRLGAIAGRSDAMVKLRGVNVFPEAIGALVVEDGRSNGEFLCVVEREGAAGRDVMRVDVESAVAPAERATLRRDLEARLSEALGVAIGVEVVEPGALARDTGVAQNTKPRRLVDNRHA